MKAAIISLGSTSSKLTAEAMTKYFDSVDLISLKKIEINLGDIGKDKSIVLVEGKPIKKYDCIYAKGSFRYNPILRAITSALYPFGYLPIKGSAFTVGHDKFLTHIKLQEQGVPMPGTYLSSSVVAAKTLLERVNYPIILKLPQGTQGKGVLFADSFAAASSILDTLSTLKVPFIIQEYIETGGTDIRALVVGDKVVASMKRRAHKGEKRSNIHAGGVGEPIILDKYTQNIAVKAAKSIGCDICGVDILESVKGPVVIEINLSPGIQGLMAATKANIPDMIAKFLFEKASIHTKIDKHEKTKEILKDIKVNQTENEIITTLDFRGERVLIPEIISRLAKFSENQEYVIKVSNNKVIISKL